MLPLEVTDLQLISKKWDKNENMQQEIARKWKVTLSWKWLEKKSDLKQIKKQKEDL